MYLSSNDLLLLCAKGEMPWPKRGEVPKLTHRTDLYGFTNTSQLDIGPWTRLFIGKELKNRGTYPGIHVASVLTRGAAGEYISGA